MSSNNTKNVRVRKKMYCKNLAVFVLWSFVSAWSLNYKILRVFKILMAVLPTTILLLQITKPSVQNYIQQQNQKNSKFTKRQTMTTSNTDNKDDIDAALEEWETKFINSPFTMLLLSTFCEYIII